jgi:hypothetical protein
LHSVIAHHLYSPFQTGAGTADYTERQLTDVAVMAAKAGTVMALTNKPLKSDTQIADQIMSFAYGSTLAETAVVCTKDPARAQENITAMRRYNAKSACITQC